MNQVPKSPYRKILLINPRLQRKMLALATLAPTLIIVSHFIAQKYFTIMIINDITLKLEHHLYRDQLILMVEQMGLFLSLCLLVITVICVVMIYTFGLKESHKIVGPITATIKYLEKIRESEVSGPLHFRKNDQFEELSQALNQTLLHLGLKYKEKEENSSPGKN